MAEEIRSICENPFHPSTKALTGAPRLRAARVGGWRIVYAVRQEDALVVIKTIGPRGAVFRGL